MYCKNGAREVKIFVDDKNCILCERNWARGDEKVKSWRGVGGGGGKRATPRHNQINGDVSKFSPVTRPSVVCERIAARKERNTLKKKGMTSRGGGTRRVPSDGVRVIVARGTETRDKPGSVTGASWNEGR